MKRRSSYQLAQLKRELQKRASREDDEDTRRAYWRLYYQAVNAEREVRELVMQAEIQRLLDIMSAYGRLPDHLADETPTTDDDADSDKPPPTDDSIDDDDIPPRQKGLWE